MKRTLMAGFIALALGGASFAQSSQSQSNPDPSKNQGATGQSSRDDTVYQKGNDSGSSTDQQKKQTQQKQNKQDKNKQSDPTSTPTSPTLPDENKGGAPAQPTVPPAPEPAPPPTR